MARRILVVPVTDGAGVTAACLGLAQALHSRRVAVAYAKPFEQLPEHGYDQSTELFRLTMALRPPQPIEAAELEKGLAGGRLLETMRDAIELTDELDASSRVLVLEGLAPTLRQPGADRIDVELAQAYDAEVVLVASADTLGPEQLAERMETMTRTYTVRGESRVIGAVINRLPHDDDRERYTQAVEARGLKVVAAVPSHAQLMMRRVSDIVRELDLQVVREGQLDRRVVSTSIIAENAPTFLTSFETGRFILVPGNRHEVLMGAALAEAGGTELAGVLLTGGFEPDPSVLMLCEAAAPSRLPILSTPHRTFESAQRVLALNSQVPGDDEERARRLMDTFADAFDQEWIASLPTGDRPARMTPARFERVSGDRAFAGVTRVAISDGTDARVLRAVCALGGLTYLRCVIVSPQDEVERVLDENGLRLPANVDVADPAAMNEDVTSRMAQVQERNPNPFSDDTSFMCALALQAAGEVDAVVGGISLDRAHARSLIRTFVDLRSDVTDASASQFVQLPDEVLAFADTALIAEPTADQLASIAAQTAGTAELFGLEPRIAFIRPSSSSPHAAEQGQRITEAMEMLRQRRPDLTARGPMAFRRAISRVSHTTDEVGNATVLVFPEIASATATVRAVAGGVGVWACPPLFQGLSRAVNTLPSDAQVRDVAQVIVGTAVQAAAIS